MGDGRSPYDKWKNRRTLAVASFPRVGRQASRLPIYSDSFSSVAGYLAAVQHSSGAIPRLGDSWWLACSPRKGSEGQTPRLSLRPVFFVVVVDDGGGGGVVSFILFLLCFLSKKRGDNPSQRFPSVPLVRPCPCFDPLCRA